MKRYYDGSGREAATFAMLECMSNRLRWGILSTSKFARTKVIPALAKSPGVEVAAIASRDAAKSEEHARAFGIPKSYGTYEELIEDPDIDVIYNPLPNHLHVPWSVRAADAGKHVLCEKPLGVSASEADELIAARDRNGVTIGEAFMVAVHPQWLWAKEAINAGRIGELRAIQGFFSYNNVDPANIRNIAEYAGGAVMDIGCYAIFTSRWILGREPRRVAALVERDADFGTDRLSSALLDFDTVQCQFTCATQLVPYQRMQFFGRQGRLEIEIPFNAPPDRPTRVFIDDGRDVFGSGIMEHTFDVCDQYTLQAEAFNAACRKERSVPVSLETARGNMIAIEGLFRAAEEGCWIAL